MASPLFARLPASRPRGRVSLGLSLAGHVVVLTALALALAVGPVPRREGAPRVRIGPYVPPPPPLPLRGVSAARRVSARPVLSVERTSVSAVAVTVEPAPQADPPVAPSPEPGLAGSPTGGDAGSADGMEGGQHGGVRGGVPGGVGQGPVLDYDRPPRAIHKLRPRYPPEAFVLRVEGTVEVEILIDAEGKVASARVVHSVPLLDAAALAAVAEWRFAPAFRAGHPVPTVARAPVTFRIH
jgi:protein TonB